MPKPDSPVAFNWVLARAHLSMPTQASGSRRSHIEGHADRLRRSGKGRFTVHIEMGTLNSRKYRPLFGLFMALLVAGAAAGCGPGTPGPPPTPPVPTPTVGASPTTPVVIDGTIKPGVIPPTLPPADDAAYVIKKLNTSLCLVYLPLNSINAGTSSTACAATHDADLWVMVVATDDAVKFRSKLQPVCLEGSEDGLVRAENCSTNTHQRWKGAFKKIFSWIEFKNEATGLCMQSNPAGDPVALRTCNDSADQGWLMGAPPS